MPALGGGSHQISARYLGEGAYSRVHRAPSSRGSSPVTGRRSAARVPATLALTLGAPASFGAFTPGVAKDYTASTTANVLSTAGDAALTVSDPGHLMNGTFALPAPLEVSFSQGDLDRAGVERPGDDHVQAAHRRRRRAAHRRVLEDADVHVVHDDAVIASTAARSGKALGMAKTIEVPNLDLAGDVSIPQFGLGVFQVPPKDTFENVTTGIAAGYRHIDTAKAYGNEAEVGQAVRASGIPREAFFITTKLWNDDQSDAVGALKTSLGRLEMEHVDMYLIDTARPVAGSLRRGVAGPDRGVKKVAAVTLPSAKPTSRGATRSSLSRRT